MHYNFGKVEDTSEEKVNLHNASWTCVLGGAVDLIRKMLRDPKKRVAVLHVFCELCHRICT